MLLKTTNILITFLNIAILYVGFFLVPAGSPNHNFWVFKFGVSSTEDFERCLDIKNVATTIKKKFNTTY